MSYRIKHILRRYPFIVVFAVVCIVLVIVEPAFRQTDNLMVLLSANSLIGIVSLGMLFMMVTGGFDLSVGANGATATVVTAGLIVHHESIAIAIIAALAAGLVIGIVNGILVAILKLNAFVVTLATQFVLSGLLLVVTGANSVYGTPLSFTSLGLGQTFGIPNPAWIFLFCAIATTVVLHSTRFGHYLYSVGGNESASRLAGVPVVSVKLRAYAIGGLFAAIAGVIMLGQTDIGDPTAGTAWPLDAIAIVVVGGASLSGGRGSAVATVLSTLLLGTVANGLNLLNVSANWQPVVLGVVILLAISGEQLPRIRQFARIISSTAAARRTGAGDVGRRRVRIADPEISDGPMISEPPKGPPVTKIHQ